MPYPRLYWLEYTDIPKNVIEEKRNGNLEMLIMKRSTATKNKWFFAFITKQLKLLFMEPYGHTSEAAARNWGDKVFWQFNNFLRTKGR